MTCVNSLKKIKRKLFCISVGMKKKRFNFNFNDMFNRFVLLNNYLLDMVYGKCHRMELKLKNSASYFDVLLFIMRTFMRCTIFQ